MTHAFNIFSTNLNELISLENVALRLIIGISTTMLFLLKFILVGIFWLSVFMLMILLLRIITQVFEAFRKAKSLDSLSIYPQKSLKRVLAFLSKTTTRDMSK